VSEPVGVDQQLVIHLFAPTGGPHADAAYTALRDLWLGCRQFFLMREPIPGIGLPDQMPATYQELPTVTETGEEAALAAQERTDADCQAILRRHHDVLNLSVVLARPVLAAVPGSGHSWWQDLDSQWSFLSDRLTKPLLGEARIYLAKSAAPPGPELDDLLPAAASITYWQHGRADVDGVLALWEAQPWADDRALRRFVLAFDDADDTDRQASTWAWSGGGTTIPPLARYLLHAVKLRYLYRVWQRDAHAHEMAAGTQAEVARLRRVPREGLRDRALADQLHQSASQARLASADLRELRQAVEIAVHNMGLIVSAPELLTSDGPFADDRYLGLSLRARLDDELFYLGIAAERVTELNDLLSREGQRPLAASRAPADTAEDHQNATPAAADDIARNVFVVHGRDDQARDALFGFLEALGLSPLGWETLVAATGSASPYLRDVIMQGIAMAQAAVVLMTPDDVVWLHPSLHGPDEDDHEITPAMQPRANVILELGMALATYANRTIVLTAGKHRPMADLGGLNYIQLTDSHACLEKIIRRLQTARCVISDDAPDGHARDWFSQLAAYTRRPPGAELSPRLMSLPCGVLRPPAILLCFRSASDLVRHRNEHGPPSGPLRGRPLPHAL